MNDEIKRIDIKEFREKGYLQEINRLFLHRLGLALEVIVDDETGEEKLGGIWDYREDLEGNNYGLANSDPKRIEAFSKKADYIAMELRHRDINRREALGFTIEPIPKVKVL